jgi:hypothetical protein
MEEETKGFIASWWPVKEEHIEEDAIDLPPPPPALVEELEGEGLGGRHRGLEARGAQPKAPTSHDDPPLLS